MLLDEPCVGVDLEMRKQVVDCVLRVKRERRLGILLVEHDMDMVDALSDRVIVMDQGHVVASGTFAEVRRNPLVIESYLGAVEV